MDHLNSEDQVVEHDGCGAQGASSPTSAEAAAAWNRREGN